MLTNKKVKCPHELMKYLLLKMSLHKCKTPVFETQELFRPPCFSETRFHDIQERCGGKADLVLPLLLHLGSSGLVGLGQEVCMLLVGRLLEHGFLPQVGRQEGVSLGDGCVGSLG